MREFVIIVVNKFYGKISNKTTLLTEAKLAQLDLLCCW